MLQVGHDGVSSTHRHASEPPYTAMHASVFNGAITDVERGLIALLPFEFLPRRGTLRSDRQVL